MCLQAESGLMLRATSRNYYYKHLQYQVGHTMIVSDN